ncbi:NAD-dependent epimerase/dehydratase family protein [Candidatus Bathyarchaeota archaeon]|nr:NAD-dependent epimerase/dehydratase family protein [Candidatus Bathyarchaeota archaeon]
MDKKKVLVTGGCGFVGSHLVVRLLNLVEKVVDIDNMSGGEAENLQMLQNSSRIRLFEGDLLNISLLQDAVGGCDLVFHLAANPKANLGYKDPEVDFQQNIVATRNLLEAMRKSSQAKTLVFTSTSTVYGDAAKIPTPEDYGPLLPVSLYGASKLCCEALISAYASLFGIRAMVYRLANVVGLGGHGVVQDLMRKLERDPTELVVLGDGTQTKSYMYIDDCIDGMLFGLEHSPDLVNVFNIGSKDQIDVRSIVKIIQEETGLRNVDIHYAGVVDGGRGWKGDVKNMLLEISKIQKAGWKPRYSSSESVRLTVKAELKHQDPSTASVRTHTSEEDVLNRLGDEVY